MKKPISIIISAYKAGDFIEECLDSVVNQVYFGDFDDYEILLGFDGCVSTKDKVLQIKQKYKKLRLFWFENNNGPYLVFNTLITKSKYDNICIFGADDIMSINFMDINLGILTDDNYVRSAFVNFKHPDKKKFFGQELAAGIVLFNKNIFFKINGFENWMCGADSDLNNRFDMLSIKMSYSNYITTLRRVHDNNLSVNNKDYNMESEYRKNIIKIRSNRKTPILEKLAIIDNVIEIN